MDSKDLPVTEWWDPEWEVYDVPFSPFEGDRVDVDTWWAAYEHGWILGWILHGTAAYIPFHFQHQLTTGCTCQTHDNGTIWAPWVAINCPKHSPALDHLKLHRSRPVPRYGTAPACMCMYGLRRVEGAPGPWEIVRRPGMRRGELMTWAFQIHPRCPHHGEARRADAVLAWAQQAGIRLDPWQETLVRSLFDGLSLRPRRAGLATARNIIAQYNQEQSSEPLAWIRLDDQERRGE